MPQIIDADAHVVEGASFARQALTRWPERVKYQTAPDGKGGFTIEGRRYPEPEGPGAGCPPEHGLSNARASTARSRRCATPPRVTAWSYPSMALLRPFTI
jgi:hypothetical protein